MDLPYKKKNYSQKYRTEWENMAEFKGWLKPIRGDASKAMCILFTTEFNAKIYDIKKHSGTKKHKQKIELKTGNKQLPFQPKMPRLPPAVRVAEGTLCLYIAEHSAILSVDHLSEACKNCFKDSEAATNLKLHRTKCTATINNVLAPHFRNVLLADVDQQKYSVIIDESTDISVSKYVGVVIRYFSNSQNNIISSFLALVHIKTSDERGIVDGLITCLQDHNMQLENMVGIGTDNASVMVGINNGMHAILKRDYGLESLVLIRCVCHSLQLAVSHASENTLPRNIEFFVREIYKWFSISPKRREEYDEIYKLINCGEEPLKITKICDTRWLSIEPAVTKILAQWEELKIHFNLARTKDNCYAAELITGMFNDESTRNYLLFLKSILSEVQTVIKSFEGEESNPLKLLNTLESLLRSICTRVLKPSYKNYLEEPVHQDDVNSQAYLGYMFENSLQASQMPQATKNLIKKQCCDFLIRLIGQIQQRLPKNYKQLEKMTLLSPEEVCKNTGKDASISELAKTLGFCDEKIDRLMQQWFTIHLYKWDTTLNIVQFWVQVKKYKNASGESIFQDLSDLALTALSLPHSNAEVERLFSLMSVVKTKHRNKMSLDTLNSLLRIRDYLKKNKQSCASYQIPMEVLDQIGKQEKYTFLVPKEPEPSISTSNENEYSVKLTLELDA